MKTFFTSDTHFNHANVIKYCNRPFKNVDEMNKTLIDKWNSKITEKDTIYHLGDFGFGNVEPILKQLNGQKFLLRGSHDKDTIKCKQYFNRILSLMELRIDWDTSIILCHYAMRVWSKSHYNSWHLYGHSHGQLPSEGKSHDVGVDNTDFFPLSFDEIKDIMDSKPDNFNLVKGR